MDAELFSEIFFTWAAAVRPDATGCRPGQASIVNPDSPPWPHMAVGLTP